ncbi:MAG: transposase [Verrucomicrobiales bacterium]
MPVGELPPFDDWENLDISIGQQGLPHWQLAGATYAIVFRLADSLSAVIKEKLRDEKILLMGRNARGEDVADELSALSSRLQSILDQGLGSCLLRQSQNAEIVVGALRHFDGERYSLGAWCVMPNHVHVIVRPRPGHSLGEILHTWKSFTAHRIQKVTGGSGDFWQKDAYNRIIRDEQEWEHQSADVARNPIEAGLVDWKWFGHGSLGQERHALATVPESSSTHPRPS